MRFQNHFHEEPPAFLRKILNLQKHKNHKVDLWNAFVDSELSGITEDDCDIFPRILPGNYLPTIKKSAYEITLFALRLLSLPEAEIRAIVPSTPIRDYLLEELQVLKHRDSRITGSFRFDMAVVGKPRPGNAPKLLEINEIGFDGLHRSSFIQNTLLSLLPELNKKVFALDTSAAEVRNMRRLGKKLTRIQFGDYNWEEEMLVKTGLRHGLEVSLVTPKQYGCGVEPETPLMTEEEIRLSSSRIKVGKDFPSALQVGFSFELKDYLESPKLYADMVRSRTPMYGSFLSGLVASKTILILMSDPGLRRKLLGKSGALESVLLPATILRGHRNEAWNDHQRLVLKHVDGLGGEMVYIGSDFRKRLKNIKEKEQSEWVIQKRTQLNTIDVQGILSPPRKVIADLGVFVQYDWSKGRFQNFELGGFITRATNRSYKVNVSGGGIQVPVMFTS